MGTPAETLSSSDHGDDMQRRLRYQAAYGALVCLQLLDDAGIVEVYCEHHEDFLIRKISAKWVGIQVKTREPHFGPFKSDEPAVVNAIEKFVNLDLEFPDKFESFVLVANCDFWQAEDNGKNLEYVSRLLREKPSTRLSTPVENLIGELRHRCSCSKKEVIATIGKVLLDGKVPKFEDITANVAFKMGQVEKFRSRTLQELVQAAIVLINFVLESSALTCNQPVRTHIVLLSDPEEESVKAVISHKRITAQAVLSMIDRVLSMEPSLQTAAALDVASLPLGHHILERKMAAGGISFQSIDVAKDHQRSAEYLLQAWFHQYGPEIASKRYEQLSVIVKTQCAESYDNHFSDTVEFGKAMLADVRKRVKNVAQNDSDAIFRARYEHLLGIASMATQECKTWWSKQFALKVGE